MPGASLELGEGVVSEDWCETIKNPIARAKATMMSRCIGLILAGLFLRFSGLRFRLTRRTLCPEWRAWSWSGLISSWLLYISFSLFKAACRIAKLLVDIACRVFTLWQIVFATWVARIDEPSVNGDQKSSQKFVGMHWRYDRHSRFYYGVQWAR